jgi:hypothetical protein
MPVAQRDILEAIHVIPELVSAKDLFANFAELKADCGHVVRIGATEQVLLYGEHEVVDGPESRRLGLRSGVVL